MVPGELVGLARVGSILAVDGGTPTVGMHPGAVIVSLLEQIVEVSRQPAQAAATVQDGLHDQSRLWRKASQAAAIAMGRGVASRQGTAAQHGSGHVGSMAVIVAPIIGGSAQCIGGDDAPLEIVAHGRACRAHIQARVSHGHGLARAKEPQSVPQGYGVHDTRAPGHVVEQFPLHEGLDPGNGIVSRQRRDGPGIHRQAQGTTQGLHTAPEDGRTQALQNGAELARIPIGEGLYSQRLGAPGPVEIGVDLVGRVERANPAHESQSFNIGPDSVVHADDEGVVRHVIVDVSTMCRQCVLPGLPHRSRKLHDIEPLATVRRCLQAQCWRNRRLLPQGVKNTAMQAD